MSTSGLAQAGFAVVVSSFVAQTREGESAKPRWRNWQLLPPMQVVGGFGNILVRGEEE